VQAATHIYNELEGTELERSANVFDVSFVPDGMTFEDEPRSVFGLAIFSHTRFVIMNTETKLRGI
jgi:hypothetical protein